MAVVSFVRPLRVPPGVFAAAPASGKDVKRFRCAAYPVASNCQIVL